MPAELQLSKPRHGESGKSVADAGDCMVAVIVVSWFGFGFDFVVVVVVVVVVFVFVFVLLFCLWRREGLWRWCRRKMGGE